VVAGLRSSPRLGRGGVQARRCWVSALDAAAPSPGSAPAEARHGRLGCDRRAG